MGEAVTKQQALEALDCINSYEYTHCREVIRAFIESQPSASRAEAVKHAEAIRQRNLAVIQAGRASIAADVPAAESPTEGVRMLCSEELSDLWHYRPHDARWEIAIQRKFCEVNAGKTIPIAATPQEPQQ